MGDKYDILFTPAKIGNCEIKNRFVMVPMAPTAVIEWTSKPEGFNPHVRDLLIERAKDGIGLIIPGGIAPFSFAGRVCIGDHPEAFEGVKELLDEIHSYGTKVFFQLTAGVGRNMPMRKSMWENYEQLNKVMNLDLTTASADEGLPNRWIPEHKTKALTVDEIKHMVEGFAKTAVLCKENGVDGIEIHALHEGYLLDQFATKHTNHRKDEYGGSLENRLRFSCDLVKAIKAACGEDYPVILRYSVETKVKEFNKGIIPADKVSIDIGRDMEESKLAVKILEEAGYDAFDADNGTYDSWYYAHPPVYMPLNCNIEESIAVKPSTSKPIICAGRMQLDESAEAIRDGKLDFVGIGRQFLTDECYLEKIRENRLEDIRPCISCHLGCMPVGLWKDTGAIMGEMGSCALNPHTKNEQKYCVNMSENPKHFAVIGAGIAGMEFAIQATKRGHKVQIYEKSDRLAGVFNEAACFTFKEKDRELIEYYHTQIEKSGIEVHFNHEVKNSNEIAADEIILATGLKEARELDVPGKEYAVNALDFLKEKQESGNHVVIIGGGLTGCEIAYELAMQNKKVSVVEMQDDILKVLGSSMANTSYLRDAFEFYGVNVYTDTTVSEIKENSVVIQKEGKTEELASNTTIVSIGYINGTDFEVGENVHVIGDADKVSNLYRAIVQANDLVLEF